MYNDTSYFKQRDNTPLKKGDYVQWKLTDDNRFFRKTYGIIVCDMYKDGPYMFFDVENLIETNGVKKGKIITKFPENLKVCAEEEIMLALLEA